MRERFVVAACAVLGLAAAGAWFGVAGVRPAAEPAPAAVAAGAPDAEMAGVCQRACAVQEPFAEADVQAQPGARAGGLARCPVSGVVFTVGRDGAEFTRAGATWYLCCGGCEAKLRDDPARFLGL